MGKILTKAIPVYRTSPLLKMNQFSYCYHEVKRTKCGSFSLKNRPNFHFSNQPTGEHALLQNAVGYEKFAKQKLFRSCV